MADTYNSDSEPTTRTLLRRVLDTADTRTPRRRRSARIGYVTALPRGSGLSGIHHRLITWCFHPKSIERLARVQTSGHLDEQTPRTLLKNILLTACPTNPTLSLLFCSPRIFHHDARACGEASTDAAGGPVL
uniref:Centromere kinetochore component CENP-T N-terminal domain-containing protein n=1 Tax=Canis lupus dingo TaxID=286419 RepID=A0A8C0L1A2_CANLU